jgi:hypothetical protein
VQAARKEATVPAEARPVDELPERWSVILWRQEELERAGWPAALALDLAERSEVDLHEACELLHRGAPVELALEILL